MAQKAWTQTKPNKWLFLHSNFFLNSLRAEPLPKKNYIRTPEADGLLFRPGRAEDQGDEGHRPGPRQQGVDLVLGVPYARRGSDAKLDVSKAPPVWDVAVFGGYPILGVGFYLGNKRNNQNLVQVYPKPILNNQKGGCTYVWDFPLTFAPRVFIPALSFSLSDGQGLSMVDKSQHIAALEAHPRSSIRIAEWTQRTGRFLRTSLRLFRLRFRARPPMSVLSEN